MTDDLLLVQPYAPGSIEADEWSAVVERQTAEQQTKQARLEAAGLAQPSSEDRAREAFTVAAVAAILGPDVSYFQGKPDWAAVKASGVAFAIAKVSEGRTYLDPSYAYNRAAIPAAGMPAGAYHYLFWDPWYAAVPSRWGLQADWFCAHADPNAFHCLDVEDAVSAGGHLGVAEFVAAYRKHYPAPKPLFIYTNKGLWVSRSGIGYDGAQYGPLWLAGYRPGTYVPVNGSLPAQWSHVTSSDNGGLPFLGWKDWVLMQFTDHAVVPGISGPVDGSAFRGSVTQLRTYISGQAPQPPRPPQPPSDPVRTMTKATQVAVHVNADGAWGPITDAAAGAVRTMRGHATVEDVKAAQKAIGVTQDGAWGPISRAAWASTVKRLQLAWRLADGTLACDGEWGPKTDAAWGKCRQLGRAKG